MFDYCADKKEYWGNSDSKTIQNTIDAAAKAGAKIAVIPAVNTRTGKNIWIIDKCIEIPSDMTVLIFAAHLRLADGIIDNMFRNSSFFKPEGATLAGEQRNIKILGVGHTVLDGGEPNGQSEQHHRDDPEHYPSMFNNVLVMFHNVRDFEISGLEFKDSRYYAMDFMYCRWGRISNINFLMYGTLENQDGMDFRIGCDNITIENITGYTGDDTIAFNAIPFYDSFEEPLLIKEKSMDIHDFYVNNVRSSSHGCSVVRFLNGDGVKIYNMSLENIFDTGKSVSGNTVLFGVPAPKSQTLGQGDAFVSKPRAKDEFYNITIKNLHCKGQSGFYLAEHTKNLTIDGLFIEGDRCYSGIRILKNFVPENVVIKNVYFNSTAPEADCFLSCSAEDDLKGLTISNVNIVSPDYIFRGRSLPIENFTYTQPRIAELNPDAHKRYTSAYGRYHALFFGQLNANRPKDNRYDKTLKEDK